MPLNASFRTIHLSALPAPKGGAVLDIPSLCSVLEAAKMLEERDVLSAPVIDEKASSDCSWSEKYLGIIDHIDLVWWMLDLIQSFGLPPNQHQHQQTILASFASTTVADLMAVKRLGLFIPLDPEVHTLLDAMHLLGKYGLRRIPVISASTNKIQNIVTQSAVVKLLSEIITTDKQFREFAKKTLCDLGLAGSQHTQTQVSVHETDTLMHAMQQICANDVSSVPVLNKDGALVGCASSQMVRHFFTSSGNMELLVQPLSKSSKLTKQYLTSTADTTVGDLLKNLRASRQHRTVIVDRKHPQRMLSLRDLLSCFVSEPSATYFRPFFSSMTMMKLQRLLPAFETVARQTVTDGIPSASSRSRLQILQADRSLVESAAVLLRDRDANCDAVVAAVDAEGRLVTVLTLHEASRAVSTRRGGLLGSVPLDRALVCRDNETLGTVLTRLRASRAPGMVVTDEANRPLRVVLDSDVVLAFSKHPSWQDQFSARLWNDWLPANAHTPPIDAETLGRRRSVSWSIQRSRTGSCGSDVPTSPGRAAATGAGAAGDCGGGGEAGSAGSDAPGSSPRRGSGAAEVGSPPRHESPLRFMGSLAARLRSGLSGSSD